MIQKQSYNKTKRVSENKKFQLTEKLDGSNIGFSKIDGELYIHTRNYIFPLSELGTNEVKNILYKGLFTFLCEYGETLKSEILEGRIIFAEWIGMGQIKYNGSLGENKVFMFCKALIDEDFNVTDKTYNTGLLKYAFEGQVIPDFISVVPLITNNLDTSDINKDNLNNRYITYSSEIVHRPVEGFVITNDEIGSCQKYVRYKRGKLTEHFKDSNEN